MNDLAPHDPLVDDIAALLEAAAADPARLDVLKQEARAQLGHRTAAPPVPPRETVASDDDDLWDNVPI